MHISEMRHGGQRAAVRFSLALLAVAMISIGWGAPTQARAQCDASNDPIASLPDPPCSQPLPLDAVCQTNAEAQDLRDLNADDITNYRWRAMACFYATYCLLPPDLATVPSNTSCIK